MFILDKNVVSELRKAKAGRAPRPGGRLGTAGPCRPHVPVGDQRSACWSLEAGVLLLERRDPAQRGVMRAWLEGRVMPPAFARRILAVDAAVAWKCARLQVPGPAQRT